MTLEYDTFQDILLNKEKMNQTVLLAARVTGKSIGEVRKEVEEYVLGQTKSQS